METLVRSTRLKQREREHHIFGIDDVLVGAGLLGGAASLFGGSGKPKSVSTLTPQQQEVSNSLVDFLLGKVNKKGERVGGLLENPYGRQKSVLMNQLRGLNSFYSPNGALYSGGGALSRALGSAPSYDVSPETTANYYTKGLYEPAFRAFDQYVAPRIRESFAGPSSALNSRVTNVTAQSLGDLTTQLNSQLATALQQNQQLQASLAESQANRQLSAASLPLQLGMGLQGANQALSPAGNPFFGQALGFTNSSQMGLYQPQNQVQNFINSGMSGMTNLALIRALGGLA